LAKRKMLKENPLYFNFAQTKPSAVKHIKRQHKAAPPKEIKNQTPILGIEL
jgi:hypothetical protein